MMRRMIRPSCRRYAVCASGWQTRVTPVGNELRGVDLVHVNLPRRWGLAPEHRLAASLAINRRITVEAV